MPKRNTGRKHSVIRDELNIKGPGIYAFTPFENIDRYRRTVIKIGESSDLSKRTSEYSTYFPSGVYMLGFLTNVKGKRITRNQQELKPRQIREELEQYIMDYVALHDNGRRIYSTDRVRRLNGTLEGETEWLFSRVENVHAALESAAKEYRADANLYYLQGMDDSGTLIDVLKPQKRALFTGIIKF